MVYQPLELVQRLKDKNIQKLSIATIRNTQYINRHIVISNHKVEEEGIKG